MPKKGEKYGPYKKRRKAPVQKKPWGRPTKKDPEVVKIIMGALREGLHVETACELAKISKQTFYSWVKADDIFMTQVEYAKAMAIYELQKEVRKGDPWKILKNLTNRYNDKIQQEITGGGGGAIKLIVEDYREEEEDEMDATG